MDEDDPGQRAPLPCKHFQKKNNLSPPKSVLPGPEVPLAAISSPASAADGPNGQTIIDTEPSAAVVGEEGTAAGADANNDAALGADVNLDLETAFFDPESVQAAAPMLSSPNTTTTGTAQSRLPLRDMLNASQSSNNVQLASESEAQEETRAQAEKQVGPGKETETTKRATEAQRRAIWLDLENAHAQARKLYTYEEDTAARNKMISRGVHRIVENAAILSQQTGVAMFLGFAHLEHGRHETKDLVWASPNICDPKRETLRQMTQEMHDNFLKVTASYREAGRSLKAKELRDHQAWVAERIASKRKQDKLEEENRQLREQLKNATAGGSSSNNTSTVPPLNPITPSSPLLDPSDDDSGMSCAE
ncbi:hypothetical protein A4X13_0g763 [Tilletia indica]|uniref:Uncharacterized protein n=1 Tax=Tilletia indica TaxID=43049 RepID=A0A177TM51_9BASI|nr:hypothetical protein A4X13_0g763 [Tilletia indica]